jgi:hypothetical protein
MVGLAGILPATEDGPRSGKAAPASILGDRAAAVPSEGAAGGVAEPALLGAAVPPPAFFLA